MKRSYIAGCLASILAVCAGNVFAGSFADRAGDEPIRVEGPEGRALINIWTNRGTSSGTQICPGVFLGNAHGVTETRSADLMDRFWINPYTFSEGNEFVLEGVQSSRLEVTLPRDYNGDTNKGPQGTDYVFLKADPDHVDRVFREMGSPIRSTDYIPMLDITGETLASIASSGDIDVFLYRPGNNSQDDGKRSFPYRSLRACNIVPVNDHNVGFDCSAGAGHSGSPLIANIQGQLFIVGLFWGGRNINVHGRGTFEQHPDRIMATETTTICEDHEAVCGQPCIKPSEIGELNIESSREDVASLQAFLNTQGFDAGPADGIFGPRTRTAMIAFFGANGFEYDEYTLDAKNAIAEWNES